MAVPEQIEDEEHEQRVERVAAIDVAQTAGKVCTRVPLPGVTAAVPDGDLRPTAVV